VEQAVLLHERHVGRRDARFLRLLFSVRISDFRDARNKDQGIENKDEGAEAKVNVLHVQQTSRDASLMVEKGVRADERTGYQAGGLHGLAEVDSDRRVLLGPAHLSGLVTKLRKADGLTCHEWIGSQFDSPEAAANNKGRATYGGEAPEVRCRPHENSTNAIEG
jgi:hypothetical protein